MAITIKKATKKEAKANAEKMKKAAKAFKERIKEPENDEK